MAILVITVAISVPPSSRLSRHDHPTHVAQRHLWTLLCGWRDLLRDCRPDRGHEPDPQGLSPGSIPEAGQFNNLGILLLVMTLLWFYFTFAEYITVLYGENLCI